MRRGIAYNGELFFDENESRSVLYTLSYPRVLREATKSTGTFQSLRVMSRSAGFSAYKDDNRLRLDGSWSPGTYATTEEDAKNVKTGKDAVSRYALPNPDPACYVFTGRPDKDTDIQRGTVEPAFNQPGGGVEVILRKGRSPRR